MTILVAVRTGSAAVLAADSKLTTQVATGKNHDGTVRFSTQTYEHAVKIRHDVSETAIAAFCGNANIGEQSAMDYFARQKLGLNIEPQEQDKKVREMADTMMQQRRLFSEKLQLKVEELLPTFMLLVAPPLHGVAPRLWRVTLAGDAKVEEILQDAGVVFEGASDMATTLFYGGHWKRTFAIRDLLKVEQQEFQKALETSFEHAAVRSIYFYGMPLQDAMDFAVFAAHVQVEMERFLPGTGACGGPIDVMTLEMSPEPKIRSFPGKSLRHSHAGAR